MVVETLITCESCGTAKVASAFAPFKGSPTGHLRVCRECIRARVATPTIGELGRICHRCGETKAITLYPPGSMICAICVEDMPTNGLMTTRAMTETVIDEGPLPPMSKYCPHCGETKPRSAFARNQSRVGGLQSWCRACHAESERKRSTKNKLANTPNLVEHQLFAAPETVPYRGAQRVREIDGAITKSCSKCLTYKPLEDFYPSATSTTGYQSWCIVCCKEKDRLRGPHGKRSVVGPKKVCRVCHRMKAIARFPGEPRNRDGHTNMCILCTQKARTARVTGAASIDARLEAMHDELIDIADEIDVLEPEPIEAPIPPSEAEPITVHNCMLPNDYNGPLWRCSCGKVYRHARKGIIRRYWVWQLDEEQL